MKKRKKRVTCIREGSWPTYDSQTGAIELVEYRSGVRHVTKIMIDRSGSGWFAQGLAVAAIEALRAVRARRMAQVQEVNNRVATVVAEASK